MARTRTTLPRQILNFAIPGGRQLDVEVATHQMAEYLITMSDPDETLRKAGLNRTNLRALEADDEVAQCASTRCEAIIATPWRLEPSEERTAKNVATMMEPWLESLSRYVFNSVLYGYSVIEVVWKQGKFVEPADIQEKPFEWFKCRYDGQWFYTTNEGEELDLDPMKFIVCAHNATYRNPYGEALLSRLYWPIYFRRMGWQYWLTFLERFSQPLLLGKLHPGAGQSPDDLVNSLLAMGRAGVIVTTSPDDEVRPVESNKDGQQFQMLETAVIKRVQKLILGQTLTSDVGKTGSLAAARVHDEVRMEKRNADLRMIRRAAQSIVNTICELNGWKKVPKIVFGDETDLQDDRAKRDATLLPVLSRSHLAMTQEYFQDAYGFPAEYIKEVAPVRMGVEGPNELTGMDDIPDKRAMKKKDDEKREADQMKGKTTDGGSPVEGDGRGKGEDG